eukprot:scaffold4923_cov115-Alexandrium_tamarense.AAC.1
MQKALYGLMRSALLFYLKLKSDLEVYGFAINPYDPCVANMLINGKQMTITWHVDDLKISHADSFEVTKMIAYLSQIYGDKMTVKRGDVHDYLGMDLDYSEKGKVKVSMIKYVKKIIDGFPDMIEKTSASPASDHLFQVRDEAEAKLLPEEQADAFHTTVAQLLFLSARARRDIQTAVAFLTTRVKQPDEDDWGKLKRVLKYLNGTRHMKLTLSVDKLSVVKWWVDASYNIHEDCKGHTGAMMSLGKGAVMSFSRKQKLNVRSSTEVELVGIDDSMPWILWARYFIEAQGYTVEQNILLQDNKSTILLATNGRWSSSKRTKHIKARFFLVKDRVDNGELEVKHEPTDMMWSGVLTKPKQGKPFRVFRSKLMDVPEEYDDEEERKRTHYMLLSNEPEVKQGICQQVVSNGSMSARVKPGKHRRSVLDEGKGQPSTRVVQPDARTRKKVSWDPSVGKSPRYSGKSPRQSHVTSKSRRTQSRDSRIVKQWLLQNC